MRKMILFAVLAATWAALGSGRIVGHVGNAGKQEPPKMVKIGDKMVPIEKVRESVHKASLAKTGGKVRRPNTARGYFILLNAADLPEDKIQPALDVIDRRAKVQTKLSKLDTYAPREEKNAITKAGGVLGVILFEDDNLSALVVAPEDGWAAINIKPLKKNAGNAETFETRVRKEILRAFAFIAGGAYTSKGDFLMRDVKRANDLDGLKLEDYGIDMLQRFENALPFYGLRPWHETTYRKACEEGWAAEPADEFQKAIWDEIHAMPSEPLKIAPETTKQN